MEIAELLFLRAGYTLERMLTDYAAIGVTHLSESVYFPKVRCSLTENDGFELIGSAGIAVPAAVTDAVEAVYPLGLIDAAEITANGGVIDMTERLSCGQGLYYAYKLVCSMTPVA